MATQRVSLLSGDSIPDTTGNVWSQPSSILMTNDIFPANFFVFKTAVKSGIHGRIKVPKDYVGTAKAVMRWSGAADFVNASQWDFDYRGIAATESADPATVQESVTVAGTAPASAWLIVETSIALTSTNLAADDDLFFTLYRDGVTDSNTDTIILFDGILEYADV